jgi:hypothetical protein
MFNAELECVYMRERLGHICERIRGTQLCLELSILAFAHWPINNLENYTDLPQEFRTFRH